MLIACDLDEVLGSTLDEIIKYYNDKYKTKLSKKDFHTYSFEEVWNCSREKSLDIVKDFFNSPYGAAIKPIPGSVEGIEKLKDNKLIIITGRQDYSQYRTYGFLAEYFPNKFSEVYHTNHFAENQIEKADICKKLGVDFLIEDIYHYADSSALNGTKAILLDYPWNAQEKEAKNVYRVKNWSKAVEKINSIVIS